MSDWQPIADLPDLQRNMFVAVGVTTGNEHTHGCPYQTDAYCVWQQADGTFARWPHPWGPTHFTLLPEMPRP